MRVSSSSSLRTSLLLLSLLLCLPVMGQIKVISQAQTYREPVVSTTSAATTAVTTAETLWSYAVPANYLNRAGRGFRVRAWGTSAANANTKTVTILLNGSPVRSQGLPTPSGGWSLEVIVLRSGVNAQRVLHRAETTNTGSGSFGRTNTALTETDAVTVSVTGTNGTASAGDITFESAIVEWL